MTFRANGAWHASLIAFGLPFGALIPLFEAKADGPYAFLNENEFVSSDPGAGSGGVSITFYERQ